MLAVVSLLQLDGGRTEEGAMTSASGGVTIVDTSGVGEAGPAVVHTPSATGQVYSEYARSPGSGAIKQTESEV
jgi:hypothetical protein